MKFFKNKKFILNGYSLNKGTSQALGYIFQHFEAMREEDANDKSQFELKHLYMRANGLTDESAAMLFEGLKKTKSL